MTMSRWFLLLGLLSTPVMAAGPILSEPCTLTWEAAETTPDRPVLGYQAYRNDQSGSVGAKPTGPVLPPTPTKVSCDAVGLTETGQHYVVVRARYANGVESVSSNEVAFFRAAAVDPTVVLKAHWRFDEGSGKDAANALDAKTPLRLSEADWITGLIGPFAFAPDERSSATLADATSLDQADSISVALWVQVRAMSTQGCVLVGREGVWSLGLTPESHPSASLLTTPTAIVALDERPLGTVRRHLALTYDRRQPDAALRLFVDGVPVAAQDASVTLPTGGKRLVVGRAPEGGKDCAGIIDDVKLWHGAVSAAALATEYEAGASMPAPLP